jgi:hypothetical protein
MDIYVYEINTQSAASGTWSANTLNVRAAILKQIILIATASSTTFDFKLIDDKNNVVYDTIRREKTATSVLDDEVEIPTHGIYTMRVYNASSDDTFSGRLLMRD